MPVSVNGKVISGEAAAVSGAPIVDTLACTIKLGEQEFPGRIPLHIRRGALLEQWALSGEGSDENVCLSAGTIGLFWRGPDLGVGDWRRDHNRDTIGFGEHVEDALHTLGVTEAQIQGEGLRLVRLCMALMPSRKEVDEEREDFTEPLPGGSGEEEEEPEAPATS